MIRIATLVAFAFALVPNARTNVEGFSLSMVADKQSMTSSRRTFFSAAVTSVGAVATASVLQPIGDAVAAPTIYNLNNGIKYAITKDVAKGSYPQEGDIIAIEYTGYLANGAIFDATHSATKNALLFKLGSSVVNKGINSMVSEMKVGQKVQAIIPPELAFGEKGICLEDGECLVKPGATVVYDIFLKKASIPPP